MLNTGSSPHGGASISRLLVTDELWERIGSLVPQPIAGPKGGRPPINNRTVFSSLVFLLRTGIGVRDLPSKLGKHLQRQAAIEGVERHRSVEPDLP